MQVDHCVIILCFLPLKKINGACSVISQMIESYCGVSCSIAVVEHIDTRHADSLYTYRRLEE
jgi:hypothetical protein